MASYDTAQYLLDRANIHDTVAKVPLFYDTKNVDGLRDEVYAPTIEIDYTSILGGEPYTVSRAEWMPRVDQLLGKFVSSQHVTSDIIAQLPQPTASATRPDKVLVHAQVAGNMVGKAASENEAAPFTQNGGLLEAELQRDPELEKQGLNPWRISKYKVTMKWDKGDMTVIEMTK